MNATKKNDSKDNWFVALIKSLPLKKQTRAQTANHIGDGMATLVAISYLCSNPPEYFSFALILIVLICIFTCTWLTKPNPR